MDKIYNCYFKTLKIKSGYSYIYVCYFYDSDILNHLIYDRNKLLSFLNDQIKMNLNSKLHKIILVSISKEQDTDIECFFVQYVPERNYFDIRGNCGNAMLGGAIATIFFKGLYLKQTFHVKNLNANQYFYFRILNHLYNSINAEIIFEYPKQIVSSKSLPTGKANETIYINRREMNISIIDAVNPYVYIDREDLKISENDFMKKLEITSEMILIRKYAQKLIGINENSVFPKLAILSRSEFKNNIACRMISVSNWHSSFALTGMVNLAVASNIPKTLVSETISLNKSEIKLTCIDRGNYNIKFENKSNFRVSLIQNIELLGE